MILNDTLKTIKHRRSIRSYQPEQIKEDELQAILEAGLHAPYAWEQAKHFTVVQNKEMLDKLNLAAKEAAKELPIEDIREIASDEKYNCFYGAPTLIIVSGDEQAPVPLEADCAAATQNMLLAAESMGLGSCWIYFVMFGLNSQQGPQLKKELGIPDGYRPHYAVVVGYKNEPAQEAPKRKSDAVTYVR